MIIQNSLILLLGVFNPEMIKTLMINTNFDIVTGRCLLLLGPIFKSHKCKMFSKLPICTFTGYKIDKFRTIKDNEILETAANVPRRQITVVVETANKTIEIANTNARKSNSRVENS